MNTAKLTEDDVRAALGLYKYKTDKSLVSTPRHVKENHKSPFRNSAPKITIDFAVRKKSGGEVFLYTYTSDIISLFEAELSARKEIGLKGLDIWFILDRKRE